MNTITGIAYCLKILAAIKHIAAEIILFLALCMQHSPTASAKSLNFIAPELCPPQQSSAESH